MQKDALKELYQKIDSMGDAVMKKWITAIRDEIQKYSDNIQPSSPFKDKPRFNKDARKGQFWLRRDYHNQSLHLFGKSPNVGRVKGFGSPVGKYHKTKPYRVQFGDKWVTMHKGQTTDTSLGMEAKQPYYHGEQVTPTAFFGVKKDGGVWGYGRVGDNATPLFYEESFADWMMNFNSPEIERIIIETGNNILADLI